MKTLKILIVIAFAGSIIPTIVMQHATPLWLRYTAGATGVLGCIVGAMDIYLRRRRNN
jgi:hypothetical protein